MSPGLVELVEVALPPSLIFMSEMGGNVVSGIFMVAALCPNQG